MPELSNDARILSAWRSNARPWTDAVRAGGIESRRLVTDRAIVEAILQGEPRTALDIGCGEGWLVRALIAQGVQAQGVDAVPELVAAAEQAGPGSFHLLTYEELAAGALASDLASPFDALVCNFSLLGDAAVEVLLRKLTGMLTPAGRLLIQTLHPLVACGDQAYADGWRDGSWVGIEGAFAEPAPWYFRTLESWVALLTGAGFRLLEMREPLHPATGRPASVLFISTRSMR